MPIIILIFLFLFINTQVYAEQEWKPPLEKADLLLFSSHADDEHLFFAGILPYCAANDIKAQVVYMTEHHDAPVRMQERLDGLWAAGIVNEPVVALFPDLFAESLEEAVRVYAQRGFSESDFTDFCVANIRRFKPLVVAGHDINGEYRHGGHMLASSALRQAVVLAADENYHPESFAEYGVWDTPKTYINLWHERKILLDIDTPLEYFDGLTAFQVSQHGFTFHKSQHWTWFYRWLYGAAESPITVSSQIARYRPGNFGLFRTTVGDDPENAGHFFENVILQKDISTIVMHLQDEDADNPVDAHNPADDERKARNTLLNKAIFGIILICAGILLFAALKFFNKKRK